MGFLLYPSDTVILRVGFPLSGLERFSDPRLILDSHVWVDEKRPGAENQTPRQEYALGDLNRRSLVPGFAV